MAMKNIIAAHNAAAIAEARRLEGVSMAKKRKRSRNPRRKEYLDKAHPYVLIIGETKTSIRIQMTGRTAKRKNAENILEYGAGRDTRLKQWIWCKAQEEEDKEKHGVDI